ncbi:MAG: endonuclease Q family protein [bacterium]|nr:endonuclease Q family protein [bacterium]
MALIADLHIHSRYSRATSPDMNIPGIAKWAKIKGINVMGTGDFTHPEWLKELKSTLQPVGPGTFEHEGIKFILTAEVSNIFYRQGECFKVHNIILAPDFAAVEKIIKQISGYGKLASDGRPILGLDPEKLVEMVLAASADCMVIPAHAWTPHFGVFGSASGFDSLKECFGAQTENIYAIETGLSSDPTMNWRLSILDRISLISNSDAHSLRKLGREANVFDFPDSEHIYMDITTAIKTKDLAKFLYTIEFFPEEGKYHYDGHRLCAYRAHPQETIAQNLLCPTCKKPVTVGVLHRVEKLADRALNIKPAQSVPFKHLIPLEEIIAEALDVGRNSQKVQKEYLKLINYFGNEFSILMNISIDEISNHTSEKITAGINKMRKGEVDINPGFDGEFGTINLFKRS